MLTCQEKDSDANVQIEVSHLLDVGHQGCSVGSSVKEFLFISLLLQVLGAQMTLRA